MGKPFIVREGKEGLSILASKTIEPGEDILIFSGDMISFSQAVAKGRHMGDPLQLAENIYIDVQDPARCVNHSCDPNCGIMHGKTLVAIKTIQPGEQLSFDYSTTMDEDFWEMECSCKSSNCRGIIKDFKYLPVDLQQYYLRLNVVPQFIVESRRTIS
ncbi:MAG TPA: SET domain-containing protein-lysine N-methyltransferase [Candidatus Nanoarchaeia archaeon]|nr:SET domain-containing protein-lysine N-methyltransferase [Candidatus Nanoarchaeia archaeon]